MGLLTSQDQIRVSWKARTLRSHLKILALSCQYCCSPFGFSSPFF